MSIQVSVTVHDPESSTVRTFITEVDGNPSRQKDRDKVMEMLFTEGAPEQVDVEFTVVTRTQEMVWAPSGIVHAHIIDP